MRARSINSLMRGKVDSTNVIFHQGYLKAMTEIYDRISFGTVLLRKIQ